MRESKRFLDALECPEDAASAANGHYWPLAMPAEEPPAGEHNLEYQFLSDRSIRQYLTWLEQMDGAGAGQGAAKIDFAKLPRTWTADTHPLALCEFLAYATGLAYRKPRQIRQHLLGLDARGRRYREGVHQYAFFDTSQPSSSVQYADTQAFVFVHERTGYLIFRGSSSFADWSTNFFSALTTESYPHLESKPQTLVGRPRPARHTGFALAWGAIAPDLEMWVRDQLHNGRMDRIVLSGHSLGGALAVLGAYHFAAGDICPVHAVVTFGAPKVGGAEFKAAYEDPRLRLKDRTLRIESAEDVVTLLSSRSDDEHVGHPWSFKKRPLRPTWQMMLLAPMVDAEQTAKKKIERTAAKQEAKKARTQPAATHEGSNRAAARRNSERTWRQFMIGLILKVLWYMARMVVHAIAAHSVERRYGLYLSTLTYQRIRKYHRDCSELQRRLGRNHENPRILEEGALAAANRDLQRHLRVTRGRHPKTFRHLANRPIRFSAPTKLAEYEKKYIHYIA